MHNIYWVGPRQSDIQDVVDIPFTGSITIFGDGSNGNIAYCNQKDVARVNHNAVDKEEDAFFYRTIKNIIKKDESALFYFYNPNAAHYIDGLSAFAAHFVCMNDLSLLQRTNDKNFFYDSLSGKAPIPKHIKANETNCNYTALLNLFNKSGKADTRFIIQAPVSSGGNGTFIVDKNNIRSVVNGIADPDNYNISVYEENNIPVNIHVVIFDNEILLLPGSIQIMHEDSHRLLYRGADFIAYRQIKEDSRRMFESAARAACVEYQALGYRGVCGIDGIICNDQVYLLEINNRFQASTGLINSAAKDAGLSSVQAINCAAFGNGWDESFRALEKIEVNYSNYFYTDNGTRFFHANHIFDVANKLLRKNGPTCDLYAVQSDGYSTRLQTNALGYLFRIVMRTNIVSINAEECVQINENLCEPNIEKWYEKIICGSGDDIFSMGKRAVRDFFLHLKISLMTQGVVLGADAIDFLNSRAEKGIRPATNNAVDLQFNIPIDENGNALKESGLYIVINAPTNVKFVEFSPFSITAENDRLHLLYYGEELAEPVIYPLDFLEEKTAAANSTPYKEVAFLSTDRLRVHLTNDCIFKQAGVGCKFCNIQRTGEVISLDAIDEVVADYCANSEKLNLRHFLVGGQTAPESDSEKIIDIIKTIRKYAPYSDIYAMVIPYSDKMIYKMYEAGMTQLACNVEVFDDERALEYMPGKRQKTRADYLHTLSYATTLLGHHGNVRTMVIVGLESRKSMIDGIREFARNGIQPILSVFRPLPDTPMKNMTAPLMLALKDIYEEVLQICKAEDMFPGPKCVNCQNNTLALPEWLEKD